MIWTGTCRYTTSRSGCTEPVTLPGITILHCRGARCIERFSQSDMLGLLIQVGAVPAPA